MPTDYPALQARLVALEPAHARRIRAALVAQSERAVQALAAYHPDSPLPAGIGPLVAALIRPDELLPALERLYVDCGGAEARLSYQHLVPPVKNAGLPGLATAWGQRLRQFIHTEGATAVRAITATTRRLVRRALDESAAAGESIAVASQRLRASVANFSRSRSVNIVRTELVSAANYGSLLGAQATGLRLEKVWISTKDGRTRPSHASADGQGAALQNGLFTVGGYRPRYPGDVLLPASERCRCRCAIGYRRVNA